MSKRRLLELFSGTHSIGKVLEGHGWEVTSLDYDEKTNPTILVDFMQWNYKKYSRDHFDFVWASPDCKTWSIATNKHRCPMNSSTPLVLITDYATLCNRMIVRLLEIFEYFKCHFCMENPRGRLRYFPPVINALDTPTTVYYGNYNYPYYKRTDIWHSFPLFADDQRIKKENYLVLTFQSSGTYSNRIYIPPLLVERIYQLIERFVDTPRPSLKKSLNGFVEMVIDDGYAYPADTHNVKVTNDKEMVRQLKLRNKE